MTILLTDSVQSMHLLLLIGFFFFFPYFFGFPVRACGVTKAFVEVFFFFFLTLWLKGNRCCLSDKRIGKDEDEISVNPVLLCKSLL